MPTEGNPLTKRRNLSQQTEPPLRARGWLLFTVITFAVLSPLRLVYNVFNDFTHIREFNEMYPHGVAWALLITLLIRGMIVSYGVFSATLLWRLRPSALAHSRRYLKLTMAYAILWPALWVMPLPGHLGQFVVSYLVGVFFYSIYVASFWLYLRQSKQVKDAFSYG